MSYATAPAVADRIEPVCHQRYSTPTEFIIIHRERRTTTLRFDQYNPHPYCYCISLHLHLAHVLNLFAYRHVHVVDLSVNFLSRTSLRESLTKVQQNGNRSVVLFSIVIQCGIVWLLEYAIWWKHHCHCIVIVCEVQQIGSVSVVLFAIIIRCSIRVFVSLLQYTIWCNDVEWLSCTMQCKCGRLLYDSLMQYQYYDCLQWTNERGGGSGIIIIVATCDDGWNDWCATWQCGITGERIERSGKGGVEGINGEL